LSRLPVVVDSRNELVGVAQIAILGLKVLWPAGNEPFRSIVAYNTGERTFTVVNGNERN
jgi:hypothetical protein